MPDINVQKFGGCLAPVLTQALYHTHIKKVKKYKDARMDRRSFLIMLTELQDSNALDKSVSQTHFIEEKAGS